MSRSISALHHPGYSTGGNNRHALCVEVTHAYTTPETRPQPASSFPRKKHSVAGIVGTSFITALASSGHGNLHRRRDSNPHSLTRSNSHLRHATNFTNQDTPLPRIPRTVISHQSEIRETNAGRNWRSRCPGFEPEPCGFTKK